MNDAVHINVMPTVLFDILGKTPISVSADDFTSTSSELPWGYHKILGPLLFSLYLLPFGAIFQKADISFHCYLDNLDKVLFSTIEQCSCSTL